MKKVLSIVLSIAMVVCLAPTMAFAATTYAAQADAAYSDIRRHSLRGCSKRTLCSRSVVDGFTDGTYKPEQTVTRAQMAKLIVAALGVAEYATAKTSQATQIWAQQQWAIPVCRICYKPGTSSTALETVSSLLTSLVTYEQASYYALHAHLVTLTAMQGNERYMACNLHPEGNSTRHPSRTYRVARCYRLLTEATAAIMLYNALRCLLRYMLTRMVRLSIRRVITVLATSL